jgi:hypothetical protein
VSGEVDIEERLRTSLQARARSFVLANPDEPPGELIRSHPRQRRRSAITHLLVVAAVAAVVALTLVFGPFRLGMSGVPSTTPGAHPSSPVSVPKGWKTYSYKEAQISVPGSWTTSPCPGSSATGRLILGTQPIIFCTYSRYRGTATVTLSVPSPAAVALALAKKNRTCGPLKVNRLVVLVSCAAIPGNFDNYTQWIIPSLGVQAVSTSAFDSDGVASRVLHTIRRR